MKQKKTMKTLSFYVPITRIDEEKRIVEGVAFANEVVEGEGGLRLKASAMQAATDDYMKFGAIRAMHQPKAIGTAAPLDPEIAKECGVFWRDDFPGLEGKSVAVLRSYISDDDDWKKAKDGTYKGYSVGVLPRVMRGRNVESCTWAETSLVDRPKDPDALLTSCRVEGLPEECEVEVSRASFAEYLEGCAPSDLRDMALDYLWNALWDIQWSESTPEEKEAAVRETCAEFTEFIVGAIASGKLPPLTDGEERAITTPVLTRLFSLESEGVALKSQIEVLERSAGEYQTTISTLTNERDGSKTELTRVQELHQADIKRAEAAEARVKALENEPARKPPVRFVEGLERQGLVRQLNEDIDAAEVEKLQARLAELKAMTPSTDKTTQDERVGEITTIRRTLHGMGLEA